MTAEEIKRTILEDPVASYWLKDAVKSLSDRDVVDALRDAQALLKYARLRYDENWNEIKQRLGM